MSYPVSFFLRRAYRNDSIKTKLSLADKKEHDVLLKLDEPFMKAKDGLGYHTPQGKKLSRPVARGLSVVDLHERYSRRA